MTNLPPVTVIADESLREQRIADIGQVSFAPCADFLLLCPCVPFFKRKPRAACGMKDAEDRPLIGDATPEQLWQRIVRENPRASDDEIEWLFLGAVIDDEDLRLQILERFFKDIRKRLSN
jgi:hypothetical protein